MNRLLLAAGLVACLVATAAAADLGGPQAYQKAVDRAVGYLQSKGQAADGSYSAQAGIGVTGLVATALLRHGRTPDDPLVAKSLKYLEGFVQPDGGIYVKDSFVKNYETSIAMMTLLAANADGRYAKQIKAAEKFLRGSQWDDEEGHDKSSYYFGGAGYGKKSRPDLSNTSFFIEALRAAGAGPDDPNIHQALIFVSRCQNLESEHNTTPFAAKNPDGGMYYTPAAGGESFAEKTPDGGLRSYASMTYAGLKSMIYAGLKPDDPRVKAALKWLQKHYDLSSDPGLGKQGLYYYYHTFAKALDAAGMKEFEDDQGMKHDWRRELRETLVGQQRPDGSWVNDDPKKKWMEDDPNLVTAYALLALSYCKPE